MNTRDDELRRTFENDGFVVARQFLPRAELDELTGQLDRYIREVVPSLADAHAFYEDRQRPETLKQMQHMGVDAYFKEYRGHPRWRQFAQSLLGEPAEGREPEWFNKPPGFRHPTPPHQDNYYFCLRPPSVVTLWLALDTVDEENGCLRYVRGSHLRGLRPHDATSVLGFSQGISDYSPDDEALEAVIRLEPGDLVAHHGETIHRADPNNSASRSRRAFAMVLCGQSSRRDEAAFARYRSTLDRQHQSMGLQT